MSAAPLPREPSRQPRILVTGAAGQVGTDLVPVLRRRHGQEAVIAAWHRGRLADEVAESGPAMELDVTDPAAFQDAVAANGITQVYHLATLLSAAGETDPDRAWTVNLGSLRTVLDIRPSYPIRAAA